MTPPVPCSPTAPQGSSDPLNVRVLVGILMLTALHAFNELVLVVAMPSIHTELGGEQWYGLMMGAYVVASISGMIWTAKGLDSKGATTVLAISLWCLLAGHILAIISWDVGSFVLARTLQGIGGGISLTLAFALVKLCFCATSRPRVLSIVDIAWVIPSLIAPVIGAWLLEVAHWRFIFAVQLVLLALSVLIFRGQLNGLGPESHNTRGNPLKEPLLMALGLGLMIYLLATPFGWHWSLLLPAAMLSIRVTATNMPQQWWLAREPLSISVCITLACCTIFFGLQTYFPLYLTQALHTDNLQAGVVLTLASLGWLSGSNVRARLLTGLGQITCLWLGFSVLLLGLACLGVMITLHYGLAAAYAGWFVGGLAMGIINNACKSFAVNSAGPHTPGQIATAISLATNIGIGFSIALGGAIKNSVAAQPSGIEQAIFLLWLVSGALTLCCWGLLSFASLRQFRNKRNHSQQEPLSD
ncbi:MFS transporter [Alteromonas aestuariivivens]|uniref:MFS transporter n=1 Tax=Alteromonas aestuariivivens TaxID=1938339 RepID=A0A3D8MF36_9ALTE|nr:MFS transporter [Alteromonas aestuariivivens]RDV29236.1 MFS transporter [Alteromonas aestuariivivens]